MQIVHHRYPVSKVDTKYIQEKKESHSKIFWKPVKIRGKYSIGGYPKILGNLIPKFFGVKYYCRYKTFCPIPMLLIAVWVTYDIWWLLCWKHLVNTARWSKHKQLCSVVDDSNKNKITFDHELSSTSKFSRRTKRK